MDPIYTAFALAAAAALALASRSLMKRYVRRRAGKVVASLLEADFWKASSGNPAARALLFAELAAWAGILVLVAAAAGVQGL
jgi:divalent metal cation (Fe/Co/Zn/Cd) transporter